MQEDFLHYIWQFKKFELQDLKTTANEDVVVKTVGSHNQNAGPDFFNAQLYIGEQLWAGNVEIHLKSSDWFVHNHENDKAYDNVILHVVWEYDTPLFRKDKTEISTLELKNKVSANTLANYKRLFTKASKWINCEKDLIDVDEFSLNNWLDRLYIERLERKSKELEELLERSNNNWEVVLFKLLAKNFGLKINSESFLSIANSVDFSVVRKVSQKVQNIEALFFGQSGLLNREVEGTYFKQLKQDYIFLKTKFKLSNEGVLPLQFFRLRPSSFPTIRLSQLANLYASHQQLFSRLIEASSINDVYSIFDVKASVFWETHYTFESTSKKSVKKLSKSFINLLIINTIVPLKFSYAKHKGNEINNELLKLISELPSEKNSIIDKFNSLKKVSKSALQSQALLQLKNEYCVKNRCLQCAIGSSLIAT
ncbi:DUF2851 family protein [Flavobacteriaceae sp. LMIT009]